MQHHGQHDHAVIAGGGFLSVQLFEGAAVEVGQGVAVLRKALSAAAEHLFRAIHGPHRIEAAEQGGEKLPKPRANFQGLWAPGREPFRQHRQVAIGQGNQILAGLEGFRVPLKEGAAAGAAVSDDLGHPRLQGRAEGRAVEFLKEGGEGAISRAWGARTLGPAVKPMCAVPLLPEEPNIDQGL